MSVVVITKFPGKATALEAVAKEHAETMLMVSKDAQSQGAIHHMFVEDTDGNVMVIDEWETEEAFHGFFDAQQDIQQVAQAAGVTGPPTSSAYRVLGTPDRF
jgi:heme-degrading monooxygenase HmoA